MSRYLSCERCPVRCQEAYAADQANSKFGGLRAPATKIANSLRGFPAVCRSPFLLSSNSHPTTAKHAH